MIPNSVKLESDERTHESLEHLSQDAKRKLGDQQAAARRQKRRDREHTSRASGTGPPIDPSIEPISSHQRRELQQTAREQIRAEKRRYV